MSALPDAQLRGHAIVPLGSAPSAEVRIVFFPHAGGSAAVFQPLARLAPPWIECVATEYRGRGRRRAEHPLDTVSELVADVIADWPRESCTPTVLFGHSMGSLVALEVCRLLEKRHPPCPLLLVASAHRAPQVPAPKPFLHQLPEDELLAQLKRLNGTPDQLLNDADFMRAALPMIRSDMHASETYLDPHPERIDADLTVYSGASDHDVTSADLAGWSELTRGRLRQRVIPGHHFYVQSEQATVMACLVDDARHLMGARGGEAKRAAKPNP